jgi:hypothetical protein
MSLNSLDPEQLSSHIRDLLERGPDGQNAALKTAHDQLESIPAASGDQHVENALELMGTAVGKNSTTRLSSYAAGLTDHRLQESGKRLFERLEFWIMCWQD